MIQDFKDYVYINASQIICLCFIAMALTALIQYTPFAAEPYYPDLSLPWVPLYVKILAYVTTPILALIMILGTIRQFFINLGPDDIDSVFSFMAFIVFVSFLVVFVNLNRAGLTPIFPIPL